jgi:hypothetical protein
VKPAVTLSGCGLSLNAVGHLLGSRVQSAMRWVCGYVDRHFPKPEPELGSSISNLLQQAPTALRNRLSMLTDRGVDDAAVGPLPCVNIPAMGEIPDCHSGFPDCRLDS